eukprot:jgi/Mesen1/10974/ME000096S10549
MHRQVTHQESSDLEIKEGLQQVDPSEANCFTEDALDSKFYFQIVPLQRQLYVWVGCNTSSMGNVYAAVSTRFDAMPVVSPLIGGGADCPGASMARRLALRAGRSVVLACNMPAKSPTLEAYAERRLLQELRAMGIVQAAVPNGAHAGLSSLSGASQAQFELSTAHPSDLPSLPSDELRLS